MAEFRFELADEVVLVTSAPIMLEQLQLDAEDQLRTKQDEVEDVVGLARLVGGQIEEGMIIGRSELLRDGKAEEGHYLVRYRAGDGRQVEDWFTPDALITEAEIRDEFDRQRSAGGEKSGDPDFAEVK